MRNHNAAKASWFTKLKPGRPLLEAWILSAIIVSISNILAQVLDASKAQEPFTFDLPRLLRFLCLDLITAPLNYKWQELLETLFPRQEYVRSNTKYEAIPLEEHDVEKNSNAGDVEDYGDEATEGSGSPPTKKRRKWKKHQGRKPLKKNWKNIWTKWFIDCVTLGAIFNTVGFVVIMCILNGQPQNIPHNLQTKTLTIIVNGYKIWPVANIIAQAFISFERRIIFFATVALLWNIYLSLVAATL